MAPTDCCPRCGSNALESELCSSGPHHARLWCRSCGKFIKWVAKPAPPIEDGRLATFRRSETTELRVNLTEYQGRPFISLRVWEHSNGQWLPCKGKGCSVRLSEIDGLVEALERAGERSSIDATV